MTEQQPPEVTLKLILAIVDQAVFLAGIIFVLNFAVFQLLGFLAGRWVWEDLPWVLPLEGLSIAALAVFDLTNRGEVVRRFTHSITWTFELGWHARYFELIRQDEERLGKYVVTAVVVLIGFILSAIGFLLLSFVV